MQTVTLTSQAEIDAFVDANIAALLPEFGDRAASRAAIIRGGVKLGGGAAPLFGVEVIYPGTAAAFGNLEESAWRIGILESGLEHAQVDIERFMSDWRGNIGSDRPRVEDFLTDLRDTIIASLEYPTEAERRARCDEFPPHKTRPASQVRA